MNFAIYILWVTYSSFASGNYNDQLYSFALFVGSSGSIGACLTSVDDWGISILRSYA